MPTRRAEAEWNGTLREGKGTIKVESGAFTVPYSFGTRFENEKGTNPEELIGAAHAGCFSMALSAGLSKAGLKPTRIRTKAAVTIDKVGERYRFRFTLKGNLSAEQMLTPLPGGKAALSNIKVKRMGLTVATTDGIVRKI